MNDSKLIISKELIEILAKNPCGPAGSGQGNPDLSAAKKIIEAARINYALPSFCAEINTEASKCIHCIVDHKPPAICYKDVVELSPEELDIEWETFE